jgi:hypothetical protein
MLMIEVLLSMLLSLLLLSSLLMHPWRPSILLCYNSIEWL